ncbi:MAG TPA: patatin-like phospholipase family protein [Candidatus Paceibacterota bacterium]
MREAKKYKLGAFLEAGGNKVFFVNGVLSILNKENIRIDMLVGSSSAAPILLAYLLHQNTDALQLFAAKLDHNKRNFYLVHRPHFPHNKIYKDSVSYLVREYQSKKTDGHFIIFGAQMRPNLSVLEGWLATLFLIVRYGLGINLLGMFRRLFKVHEMRITERDTLGSVEMTNFILGSSTIYPFINLHRMRGSLILEGALLDMPYDEMLSGCEKKIVIHTKRGITQIVKDTLHIYADQAIPNDVLDYTGGARVIWLHRLGETVMRQNLVLLKNFIEPASVQGESLDRQNP